MFAIFSTFYKLTVSAGIGDFYRKEKNMSTIEERVKKIIVEQLGADSLDTVELVMALEEEFDTEIPDEEAEKITTVQSAIDYITANQ